MIHSLFPVQHTVLDGSNYPLKGNVARSVLLVILKSHGLTHMAAWGPIVWESSAQSTHNTQKNPRVHLAPVCTHINIIHFLQSKKHYMIILWPQSCFEPCFKLDSLTLIAYKPHSNSSQPDVLLKGSGCTINVAYLHCQCFRAVKFLQMRAGLKSIWVKGLASGSPVSCNHNNLLQPQHFPFPLESILYETRSLHHLFTVSPLLWSRQDKVG